MEFRCLIRTAFSPRPLSVSPLRTLPLRQFSHSPRFSADPPLPTTTETAETARKDQNPSPSSMVEILGLAMNTGPAPPRREFASPISRFSSILPAELRTNPNSPPLGARPIPRTGPAAGRSVQVISDLPQALARLRGILTANNVKVDQLRQRFHERPGLKKKRLKSLRHRRRFKAGFKRLVTIAMEMKRKGL